MTNPITNRGTAFTRAERLEHGMIGRLPAAVETLEQQAQRCYRQLQGLGCNIDRYVFLEELQNRNETLLLQTPRRSPRRAVAGNL